MFSGTKEPVMSEFKECQNHFWSQNNQDGTGKCCIRCGLAENDLYPVEEIAAGHRIDKPSDSRELETLDKPENHISPNCKVEDV
ncbi:hypothetical protein [Acinetobacter baumannii]|uniref:hypothetical protein n=2 Tax=Acinetobacter baumannii TaxID=470 RepID=UPI001D1716C5|nr:hypothetical protein [Acinetobacter baumannii]